MVTIFTSFRLSPQAGILQPVLLTSADDDNSSPCNERPVANGMMMVIAQPGIFSTTFVQGEVVTALNDTELRLGPGTNYDTFATIPMGSQGSILEQINGLNGVLATSTYWWYVNLGGVNGWVPEAALQGQPVVFEQVIKHDKR
jgi:uncharacterized protein YraI